MNPAFRKALSVDDASAALVDHPDWLPICGGTDVLVKLQGGRLQPGGFVDLWGVIPRHIELRGAELRLGAGVTCTDVSSSDLLRQHLPPLWEAARTMGSQQVRNRATLGGNIGNASPAADMVAALMVDEARAVIEGPRGQRELPLETLLTGPGETALARGELVTELIVPLPVEGSYWRFDKLGFRQAQVIAVVSFSVRATAHRGVVDRIHLTWGAVAPRPVRSCNVERLLTGQTLTDDAVQEAVEMLGSDINPIDDHRASREYRLAVAHSYLRRALKELRAWPSS